MKLIAARNAIEHPKRPFDIDLPVVGGHPVGFVDPFFRVHGDHAHATTSELFPLLSAPLIAVFGIRGAYVLPAVGFLLALIAIPYLGILLDDRRSSTAPMFVAAACTPFLFYALEFWEHTLAIGCAATGTALFVRHRSAIDSVASGMLLGLSIVLRPEAAWYCAAVFVCAGWLPRRPAAATVGEAMAGAAITLLPLMIISGLHSGHFLSGHVASNLAGVSNGWLRTRSAVLAVWFVPDRAAWVVGGLTIAALALAFRNHAGARRVTAALCLAFVAGASVAGARHAFAQATAWNAEPALLLAFVPFVPRRTGQPYLLSVAVLSAVLVALTAPNDGGAQWGPRYLLFSSIPLAIVAADVVSGASEKTGWVGRVAVAVALISCLFIQRNAFKTLQSAKRTYSRIVEFVDREIAAGSYILTDLWWFDQVTAALYPTRIVLFVGDAASTDRALTSVADASRFFVARSRTESPDDELGSLQHTVFITIQQKSIPERALVLVELAHISVRTP